MLDSDIARELIRPHMIVVDSWEREIGSVDEVEGHMTIRLAKDDAGIHHFIPLSWVQAVGNKVRLDRTRAQVMRAWSEAPPKQ